MTTKVLALVNGFPQWVDASTLASAPKRVPFVYQSAGSYAHTISAGVTKIEVELWGAGAGGNASGGSAGGKGASGGGGGYAWGQFAVTPGDVHNIVVGLAGVSDVSASTNGGDSTFDATVLVAEGGKTPLGGAQGLPGSFSGTATNKFGETGGYGSASSASSATTLGTVLQGGKGAHGGGQGGSAFFLKDHTLNLSADGDQITQAPGGGGLFSTQASQKDGCDGQVIVWEWQ